MRLGKDSAKAYDTVRRFTLYDAATALGIGDGLVE